MNFNKSKSATSRRSFVAGAAFAALATNSMLARAAGAGDPVEVHKSPTCGCCEGWITHLRKAGFQVTVQNADDLAPLKTRLGIPDSARSCHTALVAGYFVEGHVPVAEVRRLIDEKPAAKGIAVGGMPVGSPGMEVAGVEPAAYDVLLITRSGESKTFARYKGTLRTG